ncbi:MAG: hypothetical protein WC492_04165 [Candidatus Micrarchaeia archaeon]|jgi:Na+/melibiose symporter-like transporter
MRFSIWGDDISEKLEANNEHHMALAWKMSNSLGKLGLLGMSIAVSVFALSIISFFAERMNSSATIFVTLLSLAIFAGLVSGIITIAYALCMSYIAYKYKEYRWILAMVILNMIAYIYKYFKGNDIRNEKLPPAEDKVEKYFEKKKKKADEK